jgi:hypothetical protein
MKLKARIHAKYPKNWKTEIVPAVRERSGGRCECRGECELHRTNPGPRRCEELDGKPAKWARGKIMLTTAHTCDCDPPCGNLDHLLHMCNRCHLRLDVKIHVQHRYRNKRILQEKLGQLTIEAI